MGKYHEGRRLLDSGDFAGAREMFRLGMKDGDPKCAYGAMVTALHFDEEVERAENRLRAVIPILKILADRSDSDACFIIGRCKEMGIATTQNRVTAFAFYTRAAGLGNPEAMFNLGCLYMNQGAVDKAVDFFERAAALDCMDAKRALEHYYSTQEKEG